MVELRPEDFFTVEGEKKEPHRTTDSTTKADLPARTREKNQVELQYTQFEMTIGSLHRCLFINFNYG